MTIQIDYEGLVQECLREVVARTLYLIAETGLPGNHHLYLTFCTHYPGVEFPEYLLEKYPEEVTVVLQYEFWDLEVDQEHFSVTLTFDDVQERITVPFGAIINFVDPSVKFGLQFSPAVASIEELHKTEKSKTESKKKTSPKVSSKTEDKAKKGGKAKEETESESNIVMLDVFRKK